MRIERQTPVTRSEYRHGLRSVAEPVARITRPILRRRGLANAQVVAKWHEIIGPQLASQSIPQRYVPDRHGGGTLHIRVGGGWATEMQHLEPQIIERINGFFGYRAVTRLALVQGPVVRHERRRMAGATARDADIAQPDPAGRAVETDDDDLRKALGKLASAIRRRQNSDKKS
jgi:hypothetical protein